MCEEELMRHPKATKWIQWLTLMKLREKIHKNTMHTHLKFWISKQILIVGGSESRKTDVVNQSKKQPTRYWYDLILSQRSEWIQVSISNQEAQDVGMKHFKNSDAFIEYLNNLQDVGKSIEEFSPRKEKYW